MNISEYENYHEIKSHFDPLFPYNTYLCSIPLDFTNVPTHWHDEMELIIIKKGRGYLSIDLERHEVEAGTIVFIVPGQLHSISQKEGECMEYENIIFQLTMLLSQHTDICTRDYFSPLLLRKRALPALLTPAYDYYPSLHHCISQIDDLCAVRPASYQLALKSCLFQFFYILFSKNIDCTPQPTPKKSLDKLKQIIKQVETNYADVISIEDIAALTCLSPSHFMKFFKANMGVPFVAYLNDYRLTMAARLLLSSSNSILEIAEDSGFTNLSYFNRLFKKKYNLTPSAYRKQIAHHHLV